MTARLLVPIAVSTLTACNLTGVSPIALTQRQAEWAARGPSSYSFTYAVQAFIYHPQCPSASWTITVRNRVAAGATCITGGQADSTIKLTVDTMFAVAMRAESDGNLASIQYDPTYGYPTSIVISGPPDAGSAEQAGALIPLSPPTSVRRAGFVTNP